MLDYFVTLCYVTVMYEVRFTKKATKDIRRLPEKVRKILHTKLETIALDPYATNNNIKALKSIEDAYRLRIGDYRVVYYLHDDDLIVEVVKAKHRSEVYK